MLHNMQLSTFYSIGIHGPELCGPKNLKSWTIDIFFLFCAPKRSNLFMFDWRQTAAASCAKSVLQIQLLSPSTNFALCRWASSMPLPFNLKKTWSRDGMLISFWFRQKSLRKYLNLKSSARHLWRKSAIKIFVIIWLLSKKLSEYVNSLIQLIKF